MHGALVSKTDELPLSASRLPGSLMVLGDGKSGDFLLAVPEKKKKNSAPQAPFGGRKTGER